MWNYVLSYHSHEAFDTVKTTLAKYFAFVMYSCNIFVFQIKMGLAYMDYFLEETQSIY